MAYWKTGDKLNNGKFVVEELLGSGGFGVTYKIKQTRTNKLFALKTLNELARSKPDFPQLQSKFINEAIALASCSHPNIVKVYPQGFQEGGLWCMVMEYVKGEDLSRHLDDYEKFTEVKAVKIIQKVGEALSFVHQKGLLHRDIKPANILLRSSDETPVLIDFGLAREYNANPNSIRSMTNSMTECFAPIEQYQRHDKFGAWTDVYALAATLYVLVTKKKPYPARFREHANLVPPKKHNPQLSHRLNKAIVRGLELQPENRPQTVKAWLEMLEQPKPISNVFPSLLIEDERNESDRNSQTVTRRNWLKYSGLAIASMVVALVGREITDNSDRSSDSSSSTNSLENQSESLSQLENSRLELAEYEFDVITVNDKGEEINRESGSAKYFTEDLDGGITLDLVEIPGGTFTMGSPEDELQRYENESPPHKVTLPSFYMAKHQVSQAQWKAVAAMPQIEKELNPDPSEFKGDNLPVEQVSWYDAVEFCQRLSRATGREYRLPSEAEWEYACRAGTTTPFYFGATLTGDLANYNSIYNYQSEPEVEYRQQTTEVGSFSPNAFGLHDMHGNVWEWCADTYQESYKGAPSNGSIWKLENSGSNVLKGGAWNSIPLFCRSAYRTRSAPVNDGSHRGFRCIASRTS